MTVSHIIIKAKVELIKVGLKGLKMLLTRKPDSAVLQSRKWQLIGKSTWCCIANCVHPIILHALTYNWTRGMPLSNTTPLQLTTPGLHLVSIHQTALTVRGSRHPITAYYYPIYRPRKDQRLSWPIWLSCSGRFTHISGHPSAACQA